MPDRVSEAFHDALVEDDPELLYDRAPCGYLSTTPDGQIVKANGTLQSWIGYTEAELVGRAFTDLLTAGGRIYHETHYAPLLRMQGTVREIAVDLRCKDGSRLPVLLNAVLDRDVDGTARIVRVAVFDATERRAYERELLAAKERAERSEAHARSLARTLQQTLIPPLPPSIPGLDVAAAYRPAGDGSVVGGDFYDVFPVAGGDWMVLLGDVCGKGPEAAVVTALVRHTVRALAAGPSTPGQVLGHLNEMLVFHETDRFCTALLVRLSRHEDGWRATLCTGGHPPAVLLEGGAPPRFLEVHGPLIGAFENMRYSEHELDLRPGQALVLYTDGVTEARGVEDWFGEDRLRAALSGRAGETGAWLVSHLVDDVLEFQDGVARDDIAVLALRVP
jgi:sigma-B regulation protein RsbU (phosphoserine phosphatase)